MLEGRLTIVAGERRFDLGAGGTGVVPMAVAHTFRVDSETAKVLVLEAAMPTSVNATLIASEFDTEPQLVSAVALLTTAISLVTVTGWIAYLRGG